MAIQRKAATATKATTARKSPARGKAQATNESKATDMTATQAATDTTAAQEQETQTVDITARVAALQADDDVKKGVATVTSKPDTEFNLQHGDKIVVTLFRLKDGKSFVATYDDKLSDNTARNSDTFGTAQAAVKNVVCQLSGVKAAMIADVATDLATYNKNEGDDVSPWETDDELQTLGETAGRTVNALLDGRKKERGDYLSLAATLKAAKEKCDKASTSGAISKAAWGRYTDRFFPNVKELGKNTVSEAIALGAAPDYVLNVWPQNQTSPKSFQSWFALQRRAVAGHIVTALVGTRDDETSLRAKLVAFNANEKATMADKPQMPTRVDARAVLVDTICDKLHNAHVAAFTAATEAAKGAERDKALDLADSLKSELQVAKFLASDVPDVSEKESDCEFAKSPLGAAVMSELRDIWAEYAGYEAAEKEQAAKAKKAVAAVVTTFKDKTDADAGLHLAEIAASHPHAIEVLQIAIAKVEQMQADAEKKAQADADADESDADADADAGATE